MGSYHTFFVAKEEELDRLFPGWKRVKPQKVSKEGVNPFTKQKMTVQAWDPVEPPSSLGKPSLYDDVWGPPLAPIIEVENEYMEGIERCGAPGLRALPHFRAKNYDLFILLDPLAVALVAGSVPVPPARVGCDGDDDVPLVDALPDAVATKLATIDDAELPNIMDILLAADVTGSGERGDEARTYFVARALRPLKDLAAEALRRRGRVCHYFAMHY